MKLIFWTNVKSIHIHVVFGELMVSSDFDNWCHFGVNCLTKLEDGDDEVVNGSMKTCTAILKRIVPTFKLPLG